MLGSYYVLRQIEYSPNFLCTLLSLVCHNLAKVLVVACKKIAYMHAMFMHTQAPNLAELDQIREFKVSMEAWEQAGAV